MRSDSSNTTFFLQRAQSLPLAFCKQVSRPDTDKAVLISLKGTWQVKLGKCRNGGIYLFSAGWKDFVLQHGLRIGDFIVFEHKGKLVFDVLIFDSSSCEKEFPLRNVLPNKRKRMIPVAEDSTHADDTKPLKGILFFPLTVVKSHLDISHYLLAKAMLSWSSRLSCKALVKRRPLFLLLLLVLLNYSYYCYCYYYYNKKC